MILTKLPPVLVIQLQMVVQVCVFVLRINVDQAKASLFSFSPVAAANFINVFQLESKISRFSFTRRTTQENKVGEGTKVASTSFTSCYTLVLISSPHVRPWEAESYLFTEHCETLQLFELLLKVQAALE